MTLLNTCKQHRPRPDGVSRCVPYGLSVREALVRPGATVRIALLAISQASAVSDATPSLSHAARVILDVFAEYVD